MLNKPKSNSLGASIIKLITAIIYGFRNELEYSLIMETVNYDRNKFYDTGPWKYYIELEKYAGINTLAYFSPLSDIKNKVV